jgi:hypothetical protein
LAAACVRAPRQTLGVCRPSQVWVDGVVTCATPDGLILADVLCQPIADWLATLPHLSR